MAFADAGLYARYRHLLPELLKFGVVGGIGSVIDLGGAAVLHKQGVNPLEAKAISTAVATVVTYLGSRFWTFKHRENQSLRREAVLFIILNVAGLLIAEAVIAIVTYAFGLRSGIDYNAASVVGTGLATIFRYFAYRQWVFTAPAQESLLGSALSPETEPFPDYPPWELDPAYLAAEHAEHAHAEHIHAEHIHAEHAAAAARAAAAVHGETASAVQAPTYSAPWQPEAEQGSWEPAAEHQPWMERHVTLPDERETSPILATQGLTGLEAAPVDSAADGPRAQGRHRRQ